MWGNKLQVLAFSLVFLMCFSVAVQAREPRPMREFPFGSDDFIMYSKTLFPSLSLKIKNLDISGILRVNETHITNTTVIDANVTRNLTVEHTLIAGNISTRIALLDDIIIYDYQGTTTRGINWFPTDSTNNYLEVGGALRIGLSQGTRITAIDGTNDILQLAAAGTSPIYLNYAASTGGARFYDGGIANYLAIAAGGIYVAGHTSLKIQGDAEVPVRFFDNSAEGETQQVKIYGWRTGDGASRRVLEIGVGVDASDTASFDGTTYYDFDGSLIIDNINKSGILYPNDNGLSYFGMVGYWQANNNTHDCSGQGNDGTMANGTYSTGRFGKAFEFNGSTDYVDAGSDSSLESLNVTGFTVTAWIQSPDIVTATGTEDRYRNIVSKKTAASGYRGFNLKYDMKYGASLQFKVGNGTNWLGNARTQALTPGQWYHVAGTYNTTTMKLYFDGVEIDSDAASGMAEELAYNLVIGEDSYYLTHGWNGTIDEVSIWNRSLTAEEIKSLYESNQERYCNRANTYLKNGTIWTKSGTDVYYTGGNVGINSTDPDSKLTVSGTLNFSNESGTQGIYQDVNARVCIGCTDDPASILEVAGSGHQILLTDSGDGYNQRIALAHTDGAGGYINLFDDAEQNTAKIRSYASDGVQAYFSAGNVCVNTTNCNATLHVLGGDIKIEGGGLNVTDGNISAANVFIPQYIFSHNNATIPVTGAGIWTNITFDQGDSDIKSGISHTYNDATNHTFMVMVDGIYNVDYDLDVEDTSVSASDIDVAGRLILINGSEVEGSVFEIDITKQGSETELSHNFLVSCKAGEQFVFQFTASDADVQISTHGTYGDHPESATVLMNKIANLP